MLEQRDHRGKCFTICEVDVDDDTAVAHCHHTEALEYHAQQEIRELERARSVSGSDGTTAQSEVLEQ